jgi:hypothetical protein
LGDDLTRLAVAEDFVFPIFKPSWLTRKNDFRFECLRETIIRRVCFDRLLRYQQNFRFRRFVKMLSGAAGGIDGFRRHSETAPGRMPMAFCSSPIIISTDEVRFSGSFRACGERQVRSAAKH